MSDEPRLMSVAEPAQPSPYCGYRYPPEIIDHAVWLYFRLHLSFRDVQDLLAERGVLVTHEATTAIGAPGLALPSRVGSVGAEHDLATNGISMKSC